MSTYSATPGQFITLYQDAISADVPVTLVISGANGYEVTIPSAATATGAAIFAVPAFADTTVSSYANAFISGSVTVSLNGNAVVQPLMIAALPSTTGIQPGFIYQHYLLANKAEFQLALATLTQTSNNGYDILTQQAEVSARIAAIDAVLAQLSAFQAGTSTTIDIGDGYLMSAADLQVFEDSLAATLIGVADGLAAMSPRKAAFASPALVAGITEDECLAAAGGDYNSPAYKMCIQVVQSIQYVIAETERGVKGAAALLAGVTVGVAVWAEASAGWAAAEVGKAAGIALAYVSAAWDTVSSTVTNEMHEAFNDNNRAKFDQGKNMVKNAIDIGLEWLGTLPGKIGTFFGLVSNGMTAHDGVKALEEAKCNPPPGNRVGASVLAAVSDDEFCAGYDPVNDPSAIDQISFLFADIAFNGAYSNASLNIFAEHVFYIGDISDGTNTWTGYPAIYNEAPNGAHMLIMFNKDLISGPGTYAVTTDDVAPGDNGNVTLFLDVPGITDDDTGIVVVYSQVSGSVTLVDYGEQVGDRLQGTFDIAFSATRTVCPLVVCSAPGDYTEVEITGAVSGNFDGFMQNEKPPN